MEEGNKQITILGEGLPEAALHYQHTNEQPIEIMQEIMTPDELFGFCVGNALKYILRMKFKGSEEKDLEKANTYIGWALDVKAGRKIVPIKKVKAIE